MKKEVLTQLDELIETGQQLIVSFKLKVYEYKSSVPEAELRAFVTSALSAIERIAGQVPLSVETHRAPWFVHAICRAY